MKIKLTQPRVEVVNGRFIPQKKGDVITVPAQEGESMIAKGRAIKVEEPKPTRKRTSKKSTS